MTNEQLKQRIAYLVEHGGLYEDPLSEVRNNIRTLYWMVGVALSFHVIETVARWL